MREYREILLDPEDCLVLIVDHQPQMYFGVSNFPRRMIMSNTIALAKAAKVFDVPCVLTTVEAKDFSGQLYSQLQEVYPDVVPIDRTAINCWEDENLRSEVKKHSRKKILISGLWTEACVTFPALSMLYDGYETYVVSDACGGASEEAHNMAIQRMIKAGVIPLTWEQVMLEFQRDWKNKDTYDQVMSIVKEYSGAYGIGVEYSETMLPKKLFNF
jgi:nicotinamidase-related amidase